MIVRTIQRLCKGNAVAVAYLLGSAALILIVSFALDAFVIPAMEDRGKVAGASWKTENGRLLDYMAMRNKADDANPVWRSDLFPVSVAKPKSKRILVMGDSYVWGHGYSNMNTIWWRQLQLELERRGYHDVEVIGAGLRGAATCQELAWAKKLVPIYKPDLVVWGFLTNDPDETRAIEARGHRSVKALILPKDTELPERATKVMEGLFPNLSDQLLSIRKKRRGELLAGDKFGWQFGDWEMKVLEGENFELYKKTASGVADFSRTSVPGFVITFPLVVTFATSKDDDREDKDAKGLFEHVKRYYSTRYAPVQAAYVACGMPFYNILDDYMSYIYSHVTPGAEISKFAYLINPANSHPGPMATHFYAMKAADYIEAKYPAALGPRTLNTQLSQAAPVINDCVPPFIDLKQNNAHAVFVYPDSEDNMLSMPMRKPYVQLNLEHPTCLTQLSLIGPQLKAGDVYVTFVQPATNYDDGTPIELGSKRGSSMCWKIPKQFASSAVSSIKMSAKFKGTNHGIMLDMVPATGAIAAFSH